MVINENVKKKIIPIASGKGGVGKSIMAANLSIALSDYGKDTVLIDLDLGGSNLHTYLGLKNTRPGIGNILSRKRGSFEDYVTVTPFDKLRFLPGDVLVTGVANLQFSQKKRILDNILQLDAEYIVIDLSSGCSFNVIDFFLISNSGFIVTTPHTSSVLNAFGFLKSLLYRFIQRTFAENYKVSKYLKSIAKEKKPGLAVSCLEIINKIRGIDRAAGEKLKKYISVLQPKLIVNMAKNPDDLAIIEKLRDLVLESLNLDVECMGMVFFDEAVGNSLKEHRPLMVHNKDSISARDIERIALKIVQSDKFPKMPLDFNYYKDSFELTQIEAQNDYEELETKTEEEVDIEDLLAVISAQRKKINELQGTVRMLTMKGSGFEM